MPSTPTAAHIHPSDEQRDQLVAAAATESGPIAMINLLRFADGGRESYRRYAEQALPHLERVGASIVYVGEAAQTVIGDAADGWWDVIVVVRYPSRAKFLEMVTDPDFQEISRHRTAALVNSALIATDPWTLEV